MKPTAIFIPGNNRANQGAINEKWYISLPSKDIPNVKAALKRT